MDNQEDRLTEQELDFAMHGLPIAKTFYVCYRKDGTISAIANTKPVVEDYLEVSENRVLDFLKGKRDYSRYRIEHFKQDKLPEKTDDLSVKNNLLYRVPTVDKTSDVSVVVEHDVKNSCWNVYITKEGSSQLNSMNLESIFDFYITKYNDPHFLISSLKVSGHDLESGVSLPFSEDLEKDLNQVSVFVPKNFKSYGVFVNE